MHSYDLLTALVTGRVQALAVRTGVPARTGGPEAAGRPAGSLLDAQPVDGPAWRHPDGLVWLV